MRASVCECVVQPPPSPPLSLNPTFPICYSSSSSSSDCDAVGLAEPARQRRCSGATVASGLSFSARSTHSQVPTTATALAHQPPAAAAAAALRLWQVAVPAASLALHSQLHCLRLHAGCSFASEHNGLKMEMHLGGYTHSQNRKLQDCK